MSNMSANQNEKNKKSFLTMLGNECYNIKAISIYFIYVLGRKGVGWTTWDIRLID
jgi:hypothetical protein